jgi:hypothetical protein
MGHDLFISHSAADQAIADSLCQDLEKKGCLCWLAPRDVPRQETVWSGELRTVRTAIEGCRLFLALFSKSAWESERIAEEAALARRLQRRIILVYLEAGLPEPLVLPFFAPSIRWLDLSAASNNYDRRLAIAGLVTGALSEPDSVTQEADSQKTLAAAARTDPRPGQSLIFVSYKREDLPRMLPIVERITGLGYALWLDKKIPGGVEWDSYIEATIKGCSLVLLFLSKAASESKHVRREVKFADRLNKAILTVMLEPVELGQGLEMLLTQFQMIDANRDDFFPLLNQSLAGILKSGQR